jgi:hypothetical protein
LTELSVVALSRTGCRDVARSRRVAERRHAVSNAGTVQLGAGGRKKDFPDAERLVKRLVAQKLTLSLVPEAEQRQR